MYTLWERRIYHIEKFNTDSKLNVKLYGTNGDTWTQDEKEKMERMYYGYVNEYGEMTSRELIGNQILVYIANSPYKNLEWGILKSNYKHFIMPSNPCMQNTYEKVTLVFPISPNYCLVPKKLYSIISETDVEELNNIMIENTRWFYFWKEN